MQEYYYTNKENNASLLSIRNLRISFKTGDGSLKAVRGISLDLKKGKTLALVGESGSGKSVSAKAILGILAGNKIIEDGQILYKGKDLLRMDDKEISKIRGSKIAMVFQDPLSALNPIMKVGKQIEESYIINEKSKRKDAKREVKRLSRLYQNAMPIDELKIVMTKEFDLYKQRIVNLLLEVKACYISYFIEVERFNYEMVQESIKKISKEANNYIYPYYIENDFVINSFISIINTYIKEFPKAIMQEENQTKLFQQYEVESYYDLPLEVKKKNKEVIITPFAYFGLMKEEIRKMISYLNDFVKNTSFNADKYASSFIDYYKECLAQSKKQIKKKEIKQKCLDLLKDVGIDDPQRRYNQYPFELSGGQRQRVVIAISLSLNPEILICDEPTTALDVTIQAQILDLINELKQKKNLSIIFITHDLGVVANMADEIAIMYAGKIVEFGSVYDIFYDPRHPYTWGLLSSVPSLDSENLIEPIPSFPPNMKAPPKGDAFSLRNKYALGIDYKREPPRFDISPTHYAYSWLLHENAMEVEPPEIIKERIIKALKNNKDYIPTFKNSKNSIIKNFMQEEK